VLIDALKIMSLILQQGSTICWDTLGQEWNRLRDNAPSYHSTVAAKAGSKCTVCNLGAILGRNSRTVYVPPGAVNPGSVKQSAAILGIVGLVDHGIELVTNLPQVWLVGEFPIRHAVVDYETRELG
jgi:hypothetical protein